MAPKSRVVLSPAQDQSEKRGSRRGSSLTNQPKSEEPKASIPVEEEEIDPWALEAAYKAVASLAKGSGKARGGVGVPGARKTHRQRTEEKLDAKTLHVLREGGLGVPQVEVWNDLDHDGDLNNLMLILDEIQFPEKMKESGHHEQSSPKPVEEIPDAATRLFHCIQKVMKAAAKSRIQGQLQGFILEFLDPPKLPPKTVIPPSLDDLVEASLRKKQYFSAYRAKGTIKGVLPAPSAAFAHSRGPPSQGITGPPSEGRTGTAQTSTVRSDMSGEEAGDSGHQRVWMFKRASGSLLQMEKASFASAKKQDFNKKMEEMRKAKRICANFKTMPQYKFEALKGRAFQGHLSKDGRSPSLPQILVKSPKQVPGEYPGFPMDASPDSTFPINSSRMLKNRSDDQRDLLNMTHVSGAWKMLRTTASSGFNRVPEDMGPGIERSGNRKSSLAVSIGSFNSVAPKISRRRQLLEALRSGNRSVSLGVTRPRQSVDVGQSTVAFPIVKIPRTSAPQDPYPWEPHVKALPTGWQLFGYDSRTMKERQNYLEEEEAREALERRANLGKPPRVRYNWESPLSGENLGKISRVLREQDEQANKAGGGILSRAIQSNGPPSAVSLYAEKKLSDTLKSIPPKIRALMTGGEREVRIPTLMDELHTSPETAYNWIWKFDQEHDGYVLHPPQKAGAEGASEEELALHALAEEAMGDADIKMFIGWLLDGCPGGLGEALTAFDLNGNGTVSEQEFVDGCRLLQQDTDPVTARKIFKFFDRDDSGDLSMAEFSLAVHALTQAEQALRAEQLRTLNLSMQSAAKATRTLAAIQAASIAAKRRKEDPKLVAREEKLAHAKSTVVLPPPPEEEAFDDKNIGGTGKSKVINTYRYHYFKKCENARLVPLMPQCIAAIGDADAPFDEREDTGPEGSTRPHSGKFSSPWALKEPEKHRHAGDPSTLDLQGMMITSDDLKAILSAVPGEHVKQLILSRNALDDQGLQWMLLSCEARNMNRLTLLDLSRCCEGKKSTLQLSHSSIEALGYSIEFFLTELNTLKMDGLILPPGDTSWGLLTSALENNPSIRNLSFSYMQLGKGEQMSVHSIGRLIRNTHDTLESLDLSGNHLLSIGCAAIAEGLHYSDMLHTLRLDNNAGGFSESTSRFQPLLLVCEALGINTSLQRVSMNNCMLSYDADSVLEAALSDHPKMDTLELASNPHGEHGLRCLLRALVSPRSKINRCDVSEFRSAMPPDDASSLLKPFTDVPVVLNFADPSGKYKLDLSHPQHRAILRLLITNQQKNGGYLSQTYFNEKPVKDSDFFNKVFTDGVPSQDTNGCRMATSGVASFLYQPDRDIDGKDGEAVLKEYFRKRKLPVSLSRFVAISSMYKALSGTQMAMLVSAMCRDLVFKSCHVKWFVQTTPKAYKLSLFLVRLLLPTLDSIDRLTIYDMIPQPSEKLLVKNATRQLTYFNPHNMTDHYLSNLADPINRSVVERVMALNVWHKRVAQDLDIPDITEWGTYENIRNFTLDRIPLKYLAGFPVPLSGSLSFDYVAPVKLGHSAEDYEKQTSDDIFDAVRAALKGSPCRIRDRLCALRCISHYLFLSAQQCKKLVALFPGKYRVDMAVILFTRCLEHHKFVGKKVLHNYKIFEPAQIKELRARLGRCNVLDCMNVSDRMSNLGHRFIMNLSKHEDWILAKYLIVLATKEEGENMIHGQWTGLSTNLGASYEFSPPASWLPDPPRNGFFAIDYVAQKDEYILPNARYDIASKLFGWPPRSKDLTVPSDDEEELSRQTTIKSVRG